MTIKRFIVVCADISSGTLNKSNSLSVKVLGIFDTMEEASNFVENDAKEVVDNKIQFYNNGCVIENTIYVISDDFRTIKDHDGNVICVYNIEEREINIELAKNNKDRSDAIKEFLKLFENTFKDQITNAFVEINRIFDEDLRDILNV